MQILRHYPFSILTVLAIGYLSFFTPPHTQLEEINNFDKLVHVCMYGGDWIDFIANCTGVCLASLAGHYIYRPFIQKKYHNRTPDSKS